MNTGYHSVTEIPGLKATKEQLFRLYHRYRFAVEYVVGKDVLEVACGAGMGLGFLAGKARKVIGGDIDEKNVVIARELYRGRNNIETTSLDAQSLNYPDESFDVVLLYEAIYYLQYPQRFVSEARRVLKKNGTIIICTVNKDWADFHPSPFTHRYFSVPELRALLGEDFTDVSIYGAFPTEAKGLRSGCVSLIKRIATRFHLIPGSLAARSYLKRVFLGPLQPLPAQIQPGMAPYEPPVAIPAERTTSAFKIIYTVATNRYHG